MADIQQVRQVSVDRLNRRIVNYRAHDTANANHFEATVDTIYADQRKQTQALKQRHIESKVKKPKKSTESKKNDSSHLGNMGQSKLLARSHDQTTGPGETQENEPASKKQRLVNGSIVTSVSADISEFQIVQQLRNIRSNNSPNQIGSNNSGQSSSISNPSSSILPQDLLDGLSDSALGGVTESDDIKKESDLDLPNDSLLEDLGELGSFEDMDMGINLADFVHDLDLDNIKHENSNPGIESYFKEELGDAYDDPSNISNDSGLANSSSNGQLSTPSMSKINTNSSTAPSYTHYSNAVTPPTSHSSTPPSSFTPSSFSALQQTSFNSIPCTTNSLNNPYTMSPSLPKMRMNNMPVGQSDLAAQTLKQMAEQHQTKLSPTSNPVRSSLGDYGYNNMTGSQMMGQSVPVSNQMYNNTLNQTNTLYNQGMGNDMEMKRRQQMMQQYSLQQMQHQQPNIGHCNQQVSQGHAQNLQQAGQPQSISQSQQQKPVQQTQQQSPNPQAMHQQQQQVSAQHQPQVSQQQQMQSQSQHQVPQSNNQSPQMASSMSPYSNRMSPMNTYSHVSQASNKMGMNPSYGSSMCGGMSAGIRGAYPSQTGGNSPLSPGPQGQQTTMQNGNQPPRYMQQQIMGPSMMQSSMIAQQGQMMARPPPPEYRQVAMMQQHQPMMSQQMSQNMSQMHQGMGQISYQSMRPTFRPSMGGNPMANMAGGQMIRGMGQQSIPANIPNMKGSMVSANNMNIPVTMGQGGSVGPAGSLTGNGMSVTMNQVSGGGNIGMVNTRPNMMQHARPSNVNMAMTNLGLSTQMPPSRPEWRQMMMPQGQGGMMINPNIRHGYNQTQQGAMMGQGGQMIPMQRSQPHMMGMMNMQGGPGMQHNPIMSSGNGMQGNGNMSNSMHSNPSLQPGMAIGGRMSQQHSMAMGQQGQIRMGMQMNPQVLSDTHPANMGQSQGGTSVNINQMSSGGGTIGHHGVTSVNQSISQMGSGNMTSMNSMVGNNMNPMAQVSGCNGTHVNQMNQNASVGNMNAMNAHPRSPATLGQMHPCSPVASGAGTPGGPSRPLSNPSIGLTTSQAQTVNCSQPSSGSSSPMMQQQCPSSQSQMRQNMGVNITSVRTSNPVGQVSQSHPVQSMGVLNQNSVPTQPNQSSVQCSNSGLQTNQSVLMNKSGNNVVSNVSSGVQRPNSRGGGSNGMKTSQPPTPNPPSSSASNDFDLVFNSNIHGDFESLLH